MSRKTIMTLHLYLAAFFAPIMLIVAVSGGLYLLGIKGEMVKGEAILLPGVVFDAEDTDEKAVQVRLALADAGLDSDFEYLRERGAMMMTRPTSRDFYEIMPVEGGVQVTPVSPDFVAAMMELHMGHGPGLFRILEQLMAAGLILTLLTGVVVGLQSPLLKTRTVAISAAGILVFVIFAALL